MLPLTFVFNYSVLSCQGAWLHLSGGSLLPRVVTNLYLGLQLGEKVLCVGSSHPLRSCIRMYNACINTLLYLWSRILLCGDVESNPEPTNENDVDIDVHSKFCKHTLVLNCGFAQVAISDLSSISSSHHRDNILDRAARLDRFQKLFKHSNVLPSSISLKEGKSTLTAYCDRCYM